MSLVGPRPERPFFVEKFREEIPRYMVEAPGTTRADRMGTGKTDTEVTLPSARGLSVIFTMSSNWTVGLDIKIMFMTILKDSLIRMRIEKGKKNGKTW